jgi:hypothetical protein
LLASALFAVVSLAPRPASAFEACFERAQNFAMCNGFVAGLAGLGAVAAPALALYEPEDSSAASVALGVGLGLYAGVSGGALIASSQAEPPGATLRDSGTVLGAVDLGLGGTALLLSALAGVAIAINDPGDDVEDDGVELDVAFGVAGPVAAAPGVTLVGRF